jgi:anti-anti-sigma factor
MNTVLNRSNDMMVITTCDLHELVRGQDKVLVERVAPLVRQQSVALDLRTVERIDAAGIAALIQLYGFARDEGHSFAVANATPHVKEILALVGLDRILLSPHAALRLRRDPCMEQSAA